MTVWIPTGLVSVQLEITMLSEPNQKDKDKYHMLYVGESNGTPLQYSCLENPMGVGACWAAGYGVAQSQRRLM